MEEETVQSVKCLPCKMKTQVLSPETIFKIPARWQRKVDSRDSAASEPGLISELLVNEIPSQKARWARSSQT